MDIGFFENPKLGKLIFLLDIALQFLRQFLILAISSWASES